MQFGAEAHNYMAKKYEILIYIIYISISPNNALERWYLNA